MAITVTRFQQRPPEVEAVLFEKAADAAEVAAWCGGTVDNGQVIIPDYDGTPRYRVSVGEYVVKMEGNRFMNFPRVQFDTDYTRKLV